MERGIRKEGKMGEMGQSVGIQGANKGLLEHNFLHSLRLIDFMNNRGQGLKSREHGKASRMMCFKGKAFLEGS